MAVLNREKCIEEIVAYCSACDCCSYCPIRKLGFIGNQFKCIFKSWDKMTDDQLKECLAAIDPEESPEKAEDVVNHPKHYTDGKIEVIDFIEDKKLGFCLGNAVKYISRAGKKDPTKEVEDLKKAAWYVDRRIQEIEEGKG